jgi:hypothetical protein
MKRPWAVILTATALVGCRSSQPATNPFLQTTVPPPATGAPVVLPGEQFSPGVVPQPAVAPVPQYIPPAVPVAPPPPVVAPPKDKFSPPGGSFQYNQSSLDRSQPGAAKPVMLASYREPVGQAAASPVETAAAPATVVPVRPGNTIRILPPQSSPETPSAMVAKMEPEAETSNPVLRLTVGEDRKQVDTDDEAALPESGRSEQVAIVERETDSDDATLDDAEDEPDAEAPRPVDAAAAESAGYAYAPDYGWLRGRLEYSQSMRQWKLRYIPIDGKTDQFGGSVKLPASNELAAYKAGDMVAVRGSLARETSASGSFAPRYELAHIEPVVR